MPISEQRNRRIQQVLVEAAKLAPSSGQLRSGPIPVPVSNYVSTAATGTLAPTAIAPSGGNQPHSNIQPFLCINFIIALTGIFPSRS
jgi:microcystin-dependent protein